ncbi:hypothetical protein [Allosphingosinicella sp.]|jgi:hypothetical protein|uniref:hypothetical protein n=1 Tax=Allosphingosinicella sp. TaxID=2823234 RepID=UPI002EEE846D
MAFDIAREKQRALDCIETISTASARARMAAELHDLVTRHGTATTQAQKDVLEAAIVQLRRDASIASGVSLWSLASIILVGGVTLIYFAGIFFYMDGLGPERYASIEATRPILVFTLIVAMLGFGGLLIVRPLFSSGNPQDFEARFRSAREIFLVFAGIFGTIIGFYFGAADDDSAADVPAVEVSAAGGRKVNVAVEGGHAPYVATLTLAGNGGTFQMTGEGHNLSIEVPAAQCPADATVVLFDARGRRAEDKIDQTRATLRTFGWVCPEPQPSIGAGGGNVGGNAAVPAAPPVGNATNGQ